MSAAGEPRSSARDAERLEHRLAQVRVERHRARARRPSRPRARSGVRVDPPRARPPDGHPGLERKARRVGEQVAKRRARWPGRLVEIDHALLGGDETRVRREQLRHRCPAEDPLAIAVRLARSTAPLRRPRSSPASRPPDAERPRRDTRRMWSASASRPEARTSRSWATAAPCEPETTSGWRAPRRSCRTTPNRPRTPTARRSAASRSSARRSTDAGVGFEHVVRTRIFVTPEADFDEVAKAHGEIFRDIRPVNTTVTIHSLVDPRWLLEIEVDALAG